LDSETQGAPPGAAEPSTSVPADTGGPGPDAQASPSDANTQTSSPQDDRAGLLAVVQKVTGTAADIPGGEAAPTIPDTGQSPLPLTPQTDPLDTDPSDAEMGQLIPKTRKRMERLLNQRNQARTELQNLQQPAEKWNEFNTYLTQAQLAPEDVNLLLGIGAALRRGDMKAFRDGIAPYWQLANEALGDALPVDLHDKVEGGEMTREAAAEMARVRHENHRLQGRVQSQETATTEARTNARVQAVSNAVESWEAGIKQRDPDYGNKADAVLRASQARLAEVLRAGTNYTPELAVQIAQESYNEVNGWMQRLSTPRPATRPGPEGSRHAINGARPEPKSLLEAVRLGLEQHHARLN
jgi:hypothetical protein